MESGRSASWSRWSTSASRACRGSWRSSRTRSSSSSGQKAGGAYTRCGQNRSASCLSSSPHTGRSGRGVSTGLPPSWIGGVGQKSKRRNDHDQAVHRFQRPCRRGDQLLRFDLSQLEGPEHLAQRGRRADRQGQGHRGAREGLPLHPRRLTERPKLTLERTFKASIDEVWELWTTGDGIESWWGPEGFSVAVRELDLRPGGDLLYTMSAVAPEQMEYLVKAGMPLSTDHRLTFTEVAPPRRLAYRDMADFIPDVEPYEVETVIELFEVEDGVRMVLTFDAMHDDRWTKLAVMGRESELVRLAAILEARQ